MSYTEILPNIWLCDLEAATNKSFIRERSIKIIFNCTKNLPFVDIEAIKKYRLAVDDSGSDIDIEEMTIALPQMTNLLGIAYSCNIPTIIFCYKGRQRSATLIAAFLMEKTGIEWMNAVKMIQSKSPLAFKPEINFAKSLKQFKEYL